MPAGMSQLVGTTQPIASCDSVVIFSVNGDAISQPCLFDVPTQTFDVNFESLSATINARDGVFGVIYVTLAPDVDPGDQYTIALDLGLSFLDDPEDDPVLLETRAGTLTIRAPTAPVGFSVDGGKVHPGSGAVIEIGTAEPFELQEGRLVITYDPAIATGLPEVIADPRHGDVSLVVTHPAPGKIQIDFNSALENFNAVPGDLLVMHFGTPAEQSRSARCRRSRSSPALTRAPCSRRDRSRCRSPGRRRGSSSPSTTASSTTASTAATAASGPTSPDSLQGHDGGTRSKDIDSHRVLRVVSPALRQNCDQRYWLVTSWWNWISLRLTRVPRALGQRSAEASLRSAYLPCTSSPMSSIAQRLPLKSRSPS